MMSFFGFGFDVGLMGLPVLTVVGERSFSLMSRLPTTIVEAARATQNNAAGICYRGW